MNQVSLIISIIESVYVIYMFRYFKTTYSFNLIPLKFLDENEYLKHQKIYSQEAVSHICPFGHDMAFVIAGFLILRNFIPCLMKFNNWIIGLIFLGCFLNFNCVVYFLPVLLTELNFEKLIDILSKIKENA